MSKTSASEVALSSVSGSVADTDGVNTELASNDAGSRWHDLADLFGLLPSRALAAPTACPVLSNTTLADCSAGKLTLKLDGCQYERLNKSFAKPVWTGSKLLDFGASCPKRLALVTDVTRTVGDGTERTAADGVVLKIDTSTASGYDSTIAPSPSGGTHVTKSATGRSIEILGIHYVAEKSATDSTKLWDHTVSSASPVDVKIETDGTRLVSGTVIVQHNLAKFTAKAELADVAFDALKCGCLPISGSVTTTLTGSRTGTETLDITACGQGTYTDDKGVKSTIVLTHCL
jgi:hypothetical protein